MRLNLLTKLKLLKTQMP